MIRVFVIDDHPAVVSGLRGMFRPERDRIIITGSALTVGQAIGLANPESFDIILLDLWLPLEDPVDNLKLLPDIFPGKPVVIFTREDSFMWQQKMFRAGASAYLVKTAEKSEIMSVLQRVALGETVYSFKIEKYEIRKSLFSDPYNTSWINSSRQQFLMRPEEDLSIEQVPTKENTSLSALYKAFRQIRKLLNPSDTKELMRIFYQGEN